jgi:hypothetical protein
MMSKQNDDSLSRLSFDSAEADAVAPLEQPTGRKQFVEPKLSEPVKVLKATTFFQQFSDGGGTGQPGRK